MRNPAAEMIVAAIGFVVCFVAALATAAVGNPGWGCVFAGAGIAYAIVFAIARTDMLEQRRKLTRPRVLSPPDFPPQRKHPIR